MGGIAIALIVVVTATATATTFAAVAVTGVQKALLFRKNEDGPPLLRGQSKLVETTIPATSIRIRIRIVLRLL